MHRRRAYTLVEMLIGIGVVGLVASLLLPAVQQARAAAQRLHCQNNLRQIGLATHRYYDATGGGFFLHHPFLADVVSLAGPGETFAEIYWEDALMQFVSDRYQNNSLSQDGISVNSDRLYRCPSDPSVPQASANGLGVWNRTSYLMNSQLSHRTRRYGQWKLLRFINEVGASQFIDFVERDADGLAAAGCDPRQDDFDIWLGTTKFQPWIAYRRHSGSANYLYLDGHVVSLLWPDAESDLFPDHVVLTDDSSYPD